MWAFYLTGEDLAAYLKERTGKPAFAIYAINSRLYQAELVPWLPGAQYRDELEAKFPPSKALPVQVGNWLSTCRAIAETPDIPGFLRLIYLDQNDLYLLEDTSGGSQEPVRLTESGTVTSLQLSPDGAVAYYAENKPEGARLWAVDLYTREPYPLSKIYPAGQTLELHTPSTDGAWLAFTVLIDGHGGELWSALTNAGGAFKLAGMAELKRTGDGLADCSTVPTQVQWVPNSDRLIYDGMPVCDGIYVYTPELKFVDMKTGRKGTYPSGELVFSAEGNKVAVKKVTALEAANSNGSIVRKLNVPYFALGMGEWWLYPPVLWETGEQTLLSLTPSSSEADWENLGQTPMKLFRASADGGLASGITTYEGCPWSFEFAPGGQVLAYYSSAFKSNDRLLHLSLTDGSETIDYAQSELLEFLGWGPDSQHFVYTTRGTNPEMQNWIGNACGPSQPFFAGSIQFVHWLDHERFVFESTDYAEASDFNKGITRLSLAGIDQAELFLVEFNWEGSPQWKAVLMP